MSVDVAAWLAKNTIDCKPLNARISQEQCQTNHGTMFACETCPLGGQKYVGNRKIVRKKRDKQPPAVIEKPGETTDRPKFLKKETKTMALKGTCTICNRENMSLPKKDTCGRCVYRISKGLNPLAAKKTVSVPPSAPTGPPDLELLNKNEVPLSLDGLFSSDDRALFVIIKQAARKNRRTLSGEILYRLDQSLQAA